MDEQVAISGWRGLGGASPSGALSFVRPGACPDAAVVCGPLGEGTLRVCAGGDLASTSNTYGCAREKCG